MYINTSHILYICIWSDDVYNVYFQSMYTKCNIIYLTILKYFN